MAACGSAYALARAFPHEVAAASCAQVWARCTHILYQGEEVLVSPEWASKFNKAYEGLGSLGERVLGFAYRSVGLHSCSREALSELSVALLLTRLCGVL